MFWGLYSLVYTNIAYHTHILTENDTQIDRQTHTQTHTDTDTDTDTDTHTHTNMYRWTDRQTYIQHHSTHT